VDFKNILEEDQRLRMALELIEAHRRLCVEGKVAKEEPCSPQCYKSLTLEQWRRAQHMRAILLPPPVKGLIAMGVEMYGYLPCRIHPLLLEATPQLM
jgi:hypothetical protein